MNNRACEKYINQKGFTFIELVVVIVLLGMMFSFALPRMDGLLFTSKIDKTSRWIVLNIANLKNKSVKEQIRFALNVDISANSFFITSEGMSEEALTEAVENSFKLGDGVTAVDLLFPFESPDEEKISNIFFYTKGYSDNAIIHIEDESGEKLSFIVQPFLPGVEIREGFIVFE